MANPSGGFDVLGAHAYTEYLRRHLASHGPRRDGAEAEATGPVEVDYPLAAGTLAVRTLTPKGTAFGTSCCSTSPTATPRPRPAISRPRSSGVTAPTAWLTRGYQADPNGGFDVLRVAHLRRSAGRRDLRRRRQRLFGAMTGASATFVQWRRRPTRVGDRRDHRRAHLRGQPDGAGRLATFTDPGGAEAVTDYAAEHRLGRSYAGRRAARSPTTLDTSTFTVPGNHTLCESGFVHGHGDDRPPPGRRGQR